MADELVFAHPPAVRAKAKAALDKHGSLRKAASATGIPKSTIHHWANNGGFDGLDGIDPEERTDAPVDEAQAIAEVEQAADANVAATTDQEHADLQPGGWPESPETVEGDVSVPNQAPMTAWPTAPNDGFLVQAPAGATEEWIPNTPQGLKALFRYSNSLLSGARPDLALRAAQVVDPGFGLSADQDSRLLNSLKTLLMSETLQFGSTITPPDYVRSVYDQYAIGDDAQANLSDVLHGIYVDAYQATINDQLTALGRDPIADITDQSLVDSLRDKADATAAGIVDTWNRDLANEVGQSWIDLSSQEGTQMSRAKLDDAISAWQDGRTDWKSGQWANDAAGQTNAEALQRWQDENGTIQAATFEGDDTEEPVCAQMLEDYAQPTPIDDIPEFGSLPHAGCIHDWSVINAPVADGTPLWDGT